MIRGLFTLVGAAGAAILVWGATQVGTGTLGGYWTAYGLLAGAGLTMAVAQLFGGWTKWGWPRITGGVFLLGFLPALVVAGWVLLAGQPEANWFQRHLNDWSDTLGIGGFVDDLREVPGVLAFALGLVFGFTFDTKGPLPSPVSFGGPRDQVAEELAELEAEEGTAPPEPGSIVYQPAPPGSGIEPQRDSGDT